MVDFESLCGLPFCEGAIDGTFIPIKTLEHFGDTYYCYKSFVQLFALPVWMHGGYSQNPGPTGSVGDSYTFRTCALYNKIQQGDWLSHASQCIEGVQVTPYLVAKAGLPLSTMCIKCYDDSTPS
jgi:hypothetical protein